MMEIDKNPPQIANKLWNTVRVMLYLMRKNIAKSKILMVDLHMLLKKGKIASKAKAIDYLSYYYSALTCRSSSISNSFVSPRDYEFSCSNTPLYPSKRNKYHRRATQDDQLKVLGILNSYDSDVMEASSSSSSSPLHGPNYVMNNKDETVEINNYGQVDKDAEEFINKFYKDLMRQKRLAALESPSPLHHHLYIDY